MPYSLYRDDDISVTSDITLLRKVHELFIKHNKIHTVAVEMKDIWNNKEVWYWLMTAPNLAIGLHGWEHNDYGNMPYKDVLLDLQKAVNYFTHKVSTGNYDRQINGYFYPCWNSTSDRLEEACSKLGLKVDIRKGGEVYNFHYWALNEDERMKRLEEALR